MAADGSAGGHQVGKISIRAVPNVPKTFASDLKAQLEDIEKSIKVTINVVADGLDRFREKVTAETRGLKSTTIQVKPEVIKADMVKAVAEVQSTVKANTAFMEVRPELNKKALAQVQAEALAAAKAGELNYTRGPQTDTQKLMAQAREARNATQQLRLEASRAISEAAGAPGSRRFADPKLQFARTLAETKAMAKAADIGLDIKIHDKEAEAKLAASIVRMKAEAKAAGIILNIGPPGGGGGGGGGGGFGGGSSLLGPFRAITDQGTWIFAAVATMIAPALALLTDGLLALAPVLASIVAPIGVLLLGLKGIKAALQATGLMSKDSDDAKAAADQRKALTKQQKELNEQLKATPLTDATARHNLRQQIADNKAAQEKLDNAPAPAAKTKTGPGAVIEALMKKVSDETEKVFTPVFTKVAGLIDKIPVGPINAVVDGIAAQLNALVDVFTNPVVGMQLSSLLYTIGNAFKIVAPGIADFAKATIALASSGAKTFLPLIANLTNRWMEKLHDWIQKIANDGTLDKAMAGLGTILDGVANFVGRTLEAGAKLAADPEIIKNIKTFIDSMTDFLVSTLPAMRGTFAAITEFVKELADIAKWFAAHPKVLGWINAPEDRSGAGKGWDGSVHPKANDPNWTPGAGFLPGEKKNGVLDHLLHDPGKEFGNLFSLLGRGIVGAADTVAQGLAGMVGKLGKAIVSAADAVASALTSLVKTIGKAIVSAADAVGETLLNAGKGMIDGLWKGVKAGWDGLIGWFKDRIKDIPDWVKKILGIHSPSTVMFEIGQNTMQGLANGIESGTAPVVEAARSAAQKIAAEFSHMAGHLGEGVGQSGGSPSLGGGNAGSPELTAALTAAGIDPRMFPMLQGFAATEGNNPSGVPTLGFTDSQAGATLQGHANALAKQIQDRQSVAGPFPADGSPEQQALWIANVVGQAGLKSDWQGNSQPSQQSYVNSVVSHMGVNTAGFNGGADGSGRAIAQAQSMVGQAYVSGVSDCSGAVSQVYSAMSGKNVHFTTESFNGPALGFQPGLQPGALNVGILHGGPGGGHMAATLPNGTNFESGGSLGGGPKYGGGAAGADSSQFTEQWHYTGGSPIKAQLADFNQPLGGGGGMNPQYKGQMEDLDRQILELNIQEQRLQVQLDDLADSHPDDTVKKGDLEDKKKLLEQQKRHLELQKSELELDKPEKGGFNSTGAAVQMLSQLIDSGGSMLSGFGMANINQFESDLGMSGHGALETIANTGLNWGMNLMTNAVKSAVIGDPNGTGRGAGQNRGGDTHIHVSNVDDALAVKQSEQNRQAMQYVGRVM